MARSVTQQRKAINTAAAWVIGLLIFFPILWTILTSFKTEAQAINDPPIWFFFDWTTENYGAVMERSNYCFDTATCTCAPAVHRRYWRARFQACRKPGIPSAYRRWK